MYTFEVRLRMRRQIPIIKWHHSLSQTVANRCYDTLNSLEKLLHHHYTFSVFSAHDKHPRVFIAFAYGVRIIVLT